MLKRLGLSEDNISGSLRKMASLGSWGKHNGNVKRDLLAALGTPSSPEFVFTKVPSVFAKSLTCAPEDGEAIVPIMPPHLVIAFLNQHHRKRFDQLLFGGEYDAGVLTEFWKQVVVRKDPRIQHHSMCARPGWASKAIPISIHGDAVLAVGVGKSGSKSFDVYSWQSLLAKGSTTKIKQYMFGLFEDTKVTPTATSDRDTMGQAWATCLWSLEAAFLGKFPAKDHNNQDWPPGFDCNVAGQELAGGFFLVPWSLKGDLDYFAKGLHLRHYSSNEFCEFCPANSDDSSGDVSMRWNNFRLDALWKRSLFTVAQWRSVHPTLHCLFVRFPFLTQHNVEPDELHILYLGVVPLTLGSVLWLLCYKCLPGTPESNMAEVWKVINSYYCSHPGRTEYSNLSLRSFVDQEKPKSTYPKLKGRGAEVRDLAEPLLHAWSHFQHGATWEAEPVKTLLGVLVQLQQLLAEFASDCFLPVAEAQRFKALVDDFLRRYTILANKADEQGLCLWSVVPKHHWLWHLAQKSTHLNPRANCCMIDEDYVGILKDVVSSSTLGTAMKGVPAKVAEKIRWSMHFSVLEA